jgi:hypothetical protein
LLTRVISDALAGAPEPAAAAPEAAPVLEDASNG